MIDMPCPQPASDRGSALPLSRRTLLGAGAVGALALGAAAPAQAAASFSDVPASSQFAKEIAWCREQGIITGWPDNTFRPLQPITREAFCAMLYRHAGSPAYTPPKTTKLKDIAHSGFRKEILWCYSRGITTGYPDGTFRPFAKINRDAVAAMLKRFGGGTEVTPTITAPYTDVRTSTMFAAEIDWAKKNGFLTGWPDGTYRPLQPIARDAIAALFYRLGMRRRSGVPVRTASYALSRTGESPFTRAITRPVLIDYKPVDAKKILVSTYQGKRVIHPVDAAWYEFQMLKAYRLTKNPEYLRRVEATVADLMARSVTRKGGAVYYKYSFTHKPGALDMGTPWYSGMAQGLYLSVHAMLWEITGKGVHRDNLRATMASFSSPIVKKGSAGTAPWFRMERPLDGKTSLFFEEYPSRRADQASNVVNGHIYALYGLYDAYRVTGDAAMRDQFRRGAASIRDALDAYRRPGQTSWYATTAFGRTTWGSPANYHRGVIVQLKMLASLTGDQMFARQAALLESDSTGLPR